MNFFFSCRTNCYHAVTKCSGNAEQIEVLDAPTFLIAALEARVETKPPADTSLHRFFRTQEAQQSRLQTGKHKRQMNSIFIAS